MTDMGVRLRKARESRGWSLRRMAVAAHTSFSNLSKIERGLIQASEDLIAAYETHLGVEIMQRRGVLAALVAGAVIPLALPDVVHASYTAALEEDGNGIDYWHGRAEQLSTARMTMGGDAFTQRVATDLFKMPTGIWAVSATMLTLLGNQAPRAAQNGKDARGWYALGVGAADKSQDTATRVITRGRAALCMSQPGDGKSRGNQVVAARLANEALGLSDRPTVARLDSFIALALVAASERNEAEALSLLAQARRLFDQVGTTGVGADHEMPDWRYALSESRVLSLLGNERAVTAQDWAAAALPANMPRYVTQIDVQRGLLMARSGDLRGGVKYAREALNALPVAQHNPTLHLIMDEVEASGAQR
ncbi:helix-turn-helix transcriptional regulator [Longispora sp. NPDC051575]|uniref:helix-turn-helix domain-containing protein n=1 Tax=Longispora sp. NPDC051575 TaxID=3154943 RepID=UPI003444A8DC